MTAAAFGFGVAAGLAFIAACIKIERLQEEVRHVRAGSHARCIMAVADFVGDVHEAAVLKQAAEDLASPLNSDLRIIMREEWKEDGPSPTVIWLRQRAHRIEEGLDG